MKNKPEIKEALPVYVVIAEQKFLDIMSIKQAQDLAQKTNGKVWQIIHEGEEVTFLFPV
jgi:hypothetical protein